MKGGRFAPLFHVNEASKFESPSIPAEDEKTVDIALKGIVKRFGKMEAVSHVTLDIHDGELFTLLGPSGCGKTTLLRLIAGFYKPDGGELLFNGRSVAHIPPAERHIGMVFQNYALWPHMTVFDNISYGLKLQKKFTTKEIAEKVDRVMHLVNLAGLGKRYPGQLSGGQQQRVALVRALVLDPDVLLLDEPLSNLDAKIRVQVRAEIRKLQKELKITTVYVTHDQEEALTLSDRITVMNFGKIQQIDVPKALYERPENVFVADFIGINNLMPGKVVDVGAEGELTFETKCGRFNGIGDGRLKLGDPCVVTVRPETAGISPSPAAKEALNCVEGKVSFTYYCGNAIRYDVEIEGGFLFRADCQDPHEHIPIPIGDKVFVTFPRGMTLGIPAPAQGGKP
jgi:iron(III) transport system ATP-binding protein